MKDLGAGLRNFFGGRSAGYEEELQKAREEALKELEKVTEEAANIEEYDKQALFYHDDVVPAMTALRAPVDRLEMIVDKEMWPMPSYGDLLFEV